MMEERSFDVIVIGGGPAGSTAATLVAQKGHRVMLLDRERFPRFRIGESLMPATYWTLERLGVIDQMNESHFPKKYSVQFFSSTGKSATPFYFSEVDEHISSQTWQVDRRDFDQMLLQNAEATCVDVRQEVNVREVVFEGARAVGVRAEYPGGKVVDHRSKVVVDASGQSAMLSRKFGLKTVDPKLRHAAYYTRYEGAIRGEGKDEGATLIFWTENNESWFWFIPLPGNVASVGVVGPIDHLLRGRASEPQTVFDEELARCPAIQPRLEQARQAESVGVLRDFSYVSKRIAGDGWVMAGDAFGFLDPVYSTGVFFALKSGEEAADSILAAIDANDYSARSLGRHGERYLAGMEAMRKLVYAYYDPQFSFPAFLKKHPDCREPLVNLLVGNVFRRPAGSLFDSMAEVLELPEERRLEPDGQAQAS